jgi:hypothetical protein
MSICSGVGVRCGGWLTVRRALSWHSVDVTSAPPLSPPKPRRRKAFGPGVAANRAQLGAACGIIVDPLDPLMSLVLVDPQHQCIRRLRGKSVQVLAGVPERDGYVDGPGDTALFSDPCGVSADADGCLYVADTGNNCIRRVAPDGTVSTLAGNRVAGHADGSAAQVQFRELCDVQVVRLQQPATLPDDPWCVLRDVTTHCPDRCSDVVVLC